MHTPLPSVDLTRSLVIGLARKTIGTIQLLLQDRAGGWTYIITLRLLIKSLLFKFKFQVSIFTNIN